MSAMYEKLVDILGNHFAVDRGTITPEATFEDLKMDSLFLVEFLLVIQSEFDVKLEDDAATLTDTIGHVAHLLEGRTKATAQ
ncbi:acyl carrier protein [Streptomyces tubbatahanensis]|uniref:Acyl carrier protein n=1 Tax=Streptomyces tubbatahanensis TaxID=2923272 RepID=A0ABY3XZ88_9ACTN|nr:acyl carrier protein [Streptomyces tubbatahanensis]UNS99799.1 acyl carrier protein [Streptomyces tubbatahanensis]